MNKESINGQGGRGNRKLVHIEYHLDDLYKDVNKSVNDQLLAGYTGTEKPPINFNPGIVKYNNANFTRYKDPVKAYPTILFSITEHMYNNPENLLDINAELGLSYQIESTSYNTGLIDTKVSSRVSLGSIPVDEEACGAKLIINQIPFDSMLDSFRVSDEKYMSLVDYVFYKIPNLEIIEFKKTNLDLQYAKDFFSKLLRRMTELELNVSIDLCQAVCQNFGAFLEGLAIYVTMADVRLMCLVVSDKQLFDCLYGTVAPWFDGIEDLRVIGTNGFKMTQPFKTNLNVQQLTLDFSRCNEIHEVFFKYLAVVACDTVVLSLSIMDNALIASNVMALKTVIRNLKQNTYSFRDIRFVLVFYNNSDVINLSAVVSSDILNRVNYIKIMDDVQDVYRTKDGVYNIYVKDKDMYGISCPNTYNVIARSSVLRKQSMVFVTGAYNVVLVNDLGNTIGSKYLL